MRESVVAWEPEEAGKWVHSLQIDHDRKSVIAVNGKENALSGIEFGEVATRDRRTHSR